MDKSSQSQAFLPKSTMTVTRAGKDVFVQIEGPAPQTGDKLVLKKDSPEGTQAASFLVTIINPCDKDNQ